MVSAGSEWICLDKVAMSERRWSDVVLAPIAQPGPTRGTPREAGREMVDAELIDSLRTGGESEIRPDHVDIS